MAFITPSTVLALPVYSTSQCDTSEFTTGWNDGYEHINYYLHGDFADFLGDCSERDDYDQFTTHQASGIVKNAAEVWNAQSRSEALIYRGHRSPSTFEGFCNDDSIQTPAVLVAFQKGCQALDCDWYECRFDGSPDCDCSNSYCSGQHATFRVDTSCASDRALITVNANPNQTPFGCSTIGSDPIDWVVEPDVEAGAEDVLGSLLHEFGHALGLGHPDSSPVGNNSVMQHNDDRRHLFTWDKDCVDDLAVSDSRNTEYRFVENSGGTSWSPTQNPWSYYQYTTRGSMMGGSWDVGTDSGFAGYVSDGQYFQAISYLFTPDAHLFRSPYSSTGTNNSDTLPDYLEALNTTPFIFQRFADPSDGERINYTWDSDDSDPHPPELRFAKSTDEWDSSTWSRYFQCLDPSCSNFEAIESSVPLVSAYDPYSDTDILVSVQNTDDVLGGTIHVHPGFHIIDNLLKYSSMMIDDGKSANTDFFGQYPPYSHPLFDYSVKTDFMPGVACAPDRSLFDYNCIIAWNDRMVPNGRIHYTYFRVNSSDEIEWQGTAWTRSGSLTASHVSAGYFADTFWLGWKRWTNPQRVSWSMNQGSYASWTSEETMTRPRIVDPPSFSYDPTNPTGGAEMVWTEAN